MVPPSQGDLNSSLKSKFLFYTRHLYFLNTPDKAGPAATQASASWSLLWGRKREREMSETCPVLPSCVWDLTHPPQSKGLITTVLALREATLEIKYFLTLRGGVLCLPTSDGFWFVWFLTSGKLLCGRVLGRQLTFSERPGLYLLVLLVHRWLCAISMVNRLSQCAEMCAVQIYHHLCVDRDPDL